MPMVPVPAVTLTPVAHFPEGYFLENLAVRADGSVLITTVVQKELWLVPGPEPRAEVSPLRPRLTLQIVKRPGDLHTFQVLPRRWVVERTLAWITRCRRTVRDYERLPAHHETIVYWAMVITMTRRLAAGLRLSQPSPSLGLGRLCDSQDRRLMAACSRSGLRGSRCMPAMALRMISSTNSASICSRENQRANIPLTKGKRPDGFRLYPHDHRRSRAGGPVLRTGHRGAGSPARARLR